MRARTNERAGEWLTCTDGDVAFELDILAYDCLGMDGELVPAGTVVSDLRTRRAAVVQNHIGGMWDERRQQWSWPRCVAGVGGRVQLCARAASQASVGDDKELL